MLRSGFLMWFLLMASFCSLAQANKFEEAEQRYEEGLTLQRSNNHQEAILRFNQCLFLNARLVDAYLARAESHKALKEYDRALTDLNIYLEFTPDQYDVLHTRAVLYFQLKRFKDAERDFQKLLKLSPGETAMVLYRKSAHTNGIDQIHTAQGAGFKPQLYNYLGLIAHEYQDCYRAIRYLDSAIYYNPSEPDFYTNRAMIKQACKANTYKEDYTKALSLNPEHTIANYNLANEKAKASTDSETLLTETIMNDSSLVNSWLARAYYRMETGRYTEALADYDKALSIDPSSTDALLNRGHVKEKLSNLKGAYADYTHAIDLQENMVKAWLNRGNVLMKLKRYEDAVKDYSAAITFQPDYGAAYFNRAIALHQLNRNNEACSDLLMAEKLNAKVDRKTKAGICK